MVIHYNNGEKERLIKGVLHIMVIDGERPVIALLENGKELKIRIDRIEAIFDDDLVGEEVTE